MEDFKKFIGNVGGVWALILSGGALLPVLGLFAGLAPHGQFFSEETLAALTGFLALLVLLNVWVFASGLTRRASKRLFAAISLAALMVLGAYFYMITRFELRVSGERFIAGCEWTRFALDEAAAERMLSPDTCPGDADFLLRDAATPSEIWTKASMTAMERWLYLLWGGLTITWSSLVSVFALAFLAERKPRVRATPPE